MTQSVEYGEHLMLIIGCSSLGTDTACDDILVFADPFDITNHLQDGYLAESFQRYFYAWAACGVMRESERIRQFATIKQTISFEN